MKLFHTRSLSFQFPLIAVGSLLFLVVIAFGAYYKLTGYALLFSNITDNAMPKLVRMANIDSNIKELSYLVKELNDVSGSTSRKITYRRIKEILMLVKKDKLFIFNKQDIAVKIQVIEESVENLNLLVKQRNQYSRQIHDNIAILTRKGKKFRSNELNRILSLINSLKNYDLHKVSKLDLLVKDIKQSFHLFREKGRARVDKKSFETIESAIFAPDGIIELKKKELNTKMQLKRMTVLISSLIYNFSGEIDFLSVNYNKDLINESKNSSLLLKKDIRMLFFLFICYFIYIIFAIFYLKKKIINKLITLNKDICRKIEGGEKIVNDNYDEISYIRNSFNYYVSVVEEQNEKLEELSLTDALTNLFNRRMFDIQFERELKFIQRNRHVSSIFIVDVDNFKLYNDNYGHLEGDTCLKIISKVFRETFKRDTDIVARYGGEEFVFILSNSDSKNSKEIASDLLKSIEDLHIKHEFNGDRDYLTVSIGITTINYKNAKLGKINIENADKALYAAKEKGKNTFVHYEDFCCADEGNYETETLQ